MFSSVIYYFPAILLFVIGYYETFTWLLKSWLTYQGSHGPVILAISIYMIWVQRDQIRRLEVEPNLPLGILLTTGGSVLLISGKFSSILLLQYLSLIVALLGFVWLIWGTRHLKALWFPIAYLIFMFPLFSDILDLFSIYFQTSAAWIASNILSLSGVAVLRNGHFIELPSITLDVAKECSGINHIIALVSLTIPLAYWTQRTWPKKMFLFISAFLIGIMANGFRIAIIGFWTVFNPGSRAHGPYDIFYVSFIFFFGMAMLLVISALLTGKNNTAATPLSPGIPIDRVRKFPRPISPIVAVTTIFVLAAGYLILLKPQPVYLREPITDFPNSIGDWTGHDVTFTDPLYKNFLADIELKRVYRDPAGREIKLYIGYFPLQEQDREVVGDRFDSLQQNARVTGIPVNSKVIEIKDVESSEIKFTRSTYFWYDVNGKILVSRYTSKLRTIFDAFLSRRTNAAIIIISAEHLNDISQNKDAYEVEFIKSVFPVIRTYLRTETT